MSKTALEQFQEIEREIADRSYADRLGFLEILSIEIDGALDALKHEGE